MPHSTSLSNECKSTPTTCTPTLLRAVSERIESVGGFPNQLVSASSFAPREGGGGDGCFRRSSRAGGRGGGVGRVVAQSGGRAFQSGRRERRALGEAVQYHGRDFADAFRGRSALRPDRGASRLSLGPDPTQAGHHAARDKGTADRQLRRALCGLGAVAFLRPSRDHL